MSEDEKENFVIRQENLKKERVWETKREKIRERARHRENFKEIERES